ncbi:unnamed protein product [Paramecium primaurelia]|nr:unnamed protein product [Paramecium primaurelia]
MQKQFMKCPQLNIVIIKRGNNERIQLSKFCKIDILIGLDMKMIYTIIYLNMTHISNYWSNLYITDHVNDLYIQYKYIDFKTIGQRIHNQYQDKTNNKIMGFMIQLSQQSQFELSRVQYLWFQ